MKLSARLLAYYLNKKYSVELSEEMSEEPCLHYPLISRETHPDMYNVVYVSDSAGFLLPEHLLRRSMVVYVGVTPPARLRAFPNICSISRSVTAGEVFLYVQGIFDLFSSWDEALMSLPLAFGIDGVLYAGPAADVLAAATSFFVLRPEFRAMREAAERLEAGAE